MCPRCAEPKSKVVQTELCWDGSPFIRRHRLCTQCDCHYVTKETTIALYKYDAIKKRRRRVDINMQSMFATN